MKKIRILALVVIMVVILSVKLVFFLHGGSKNIEAPKDAVKKTDNHDGKKGCWMNDEGGITCND